MPHKRSKYTDSAKAPQKGTVRINKYMADTGLASRRQADELIAKGQVFVDGKKATMGMQIDPKASKVEIKGAKQQYVYYAYNKPQGIVTTGKQGDEEDIISSTKFHKQGIFPVGRLDKDSHGLIILTNDRRITHRLLDPKFTHEKEYRVSLRGKLSHAFVKKLELGVIIDKKRTKPIKVFRENDHTFRIILTEGRNRQIRRMVEAAGDMVIDLLRIRIEHIKLGDIKEGEFKAIPKQDIQKLLKKLGL